ncbi:MAG: hypothetical protein KDB55_17870 [Mycobacterium sp.]|nr:hypothetical protein [Mycobacterium sp.]
MTVALGLVVAGCGKKDESSSASSSTSTTTSTTTSTSTSTESTAAEAAPDYASLLVKAADIPQVENSPWVGDEPKVTMTPAPPDVTQTFTSGTNAINVSVLIADDATQAATALTGAEQSVPSQVTGPTNPLPGVTPDAKVTIGTSPDGKAAMAALVFSVDRTVNILVFGSAPGDLNPVPQDYIEMVGKAQVAAVEAGLPELK